MRSRDHFADRVVHFVIRGGKTPCLIAAEDDPVAAVENQRHLALNRLVLVETREELGPALEDAFRIHTLCWDGRRDASGFVTPTGKRFHRTAVLRLAELDVPRLVTIRLDGRAIAFALSMHLAGRAYGVTMAFDPAYARFAPGSEAKLRSLEAAAVEGITRVELLGHAAAHKQRFTDRFEPIYQAIGLARTLRGRAAVEALTGGIRVRRQLKCSQTARKLYYRVPKLGRG